ncbi:MAG TPA: TAT-variant-translocated molybdopterin oxidoreductase [Candidatus Sulfotelmatobacter sp.]|nr:TAT-variant-translocated molybdopterin oxidoreductase [Candidatus Sulfotelmatobacter sp.]
MGRDHAPQGTGPDYWRSLAELAGTPEFQAMLKREFPEDAAVWSDEVGRRAFLKLMGASLAFAGLTACGRPDDTIVPYAVPPEGVVPGKPLFFATAMTLGGYATGLLVESHMGRPTKVEGNPSHPASLGATPAFAQAAVLTLYDPERSQTILRGGLSSAWTTLTAALQSALGGLQGDRGAGLRLLTETVTSPSLAAQIRALLARYPQARWCQYEPAGRDAARAGAQLAFGEPVHTYFDVEKAGVILSLGSDFLASGPGCVRYAHDFAAGRRVRSPQEGMNRLYVVESMPTSTGSAADHRLPLRASDMEAFTRALARRLGAAGALQVEPLPAQAKWLDAVARDLQRSRGRSLVIAGEEQPAIVHALVHGLNEALGNVGQTVLYTQPIEAEPADQQASLKQLVDEMQAGQVQLLVVLGGNPVYTAPADLRFEQALGKVALRVHLGMYEDETARLCHWHVPETHFLESWGDARAYDGTVSIIQPLIAPIAPVRRSAHQLLATLLGDPEQSTHDLVRGYWQSRYRGPDFEQFWRKALQDGVVPDTATPARSVRVRPGALVQPPTEAPAAPAAPAGLELTFRPDPFLWDGRFSNNGWLQELPRPITRLTWDNAAMLAPATASRLGVASEDVVEVAVGERTLRLPVLIVPGHAPDSVTINLGYGRREAGTVGTGAGANAYLLRTTAAPWVAAGARLRKTGERSRLAITQGHQTMEGRAIVREGTLDEYRKDPGFAPAMTHAPARDESLYPGFKYEGYRWGMSIDLTACTGCSACAQACQAENNIPVVGKDQVLRGREMHWIRVDHYFQGEPDTPAIVPQPVPCMQCENAPCELVCPVGATLHSSEGLNDQVYNRCVGTRFCSNNCPYKVRRFNFLKFADDKTPLLKLLYNPDVTVRSRGVMEKCTYCVQRIREADIVARREDRRIQDGEVKTACQMACPTGAIVFGDLNDPKSEVRRLTSQPRNYGLLSELNTRPRTTYLARIRNPNPEIEAA